MPRVCFTRTIYEDDNTANKHSIVYDIHLKYVQLSRAWLNHIQVEFFNLIFHAELFPSEYFLHG